MPPQNTRNQITAGRSGAEVNGEDSGGVIQRSQATFEATLTTRTTASIEKKRKRAPGSTALGIEAQRRRPPKTQRREEDVRTCIFDETYNTAIDQGAAIRKTTMAPGKCIHAGQRP